MEKKEFDSCAVGVIKKRKREKSICNFFIAALVCLFLLGPGIIYGFERLRLELPTWVTAQEAEYLNGGSSADVALNGNVLTSFQDGALQEAVEAKINKEIPMKAFALLKNAELQRGFISISSNLFGWSCYPTFFGSDVLYAPAKEMLFSIPMKKSEQIEQLAELYCDGLSKIAAANPNVEFKVLVANKADSLAVNPAREYVSETYTTDDLVEFLENENENSNLTISTNGFHGVDEFSDEYYRGDHHWNMKGALRAFFEMVDMSSEEQEALNHFTSIDGPEFYGYHSRSGLCMVADSPFDVCVDFSQLQCLRSGEWYSGDDVHEYSGAAAPSQSFQFYDRYWTTNDEIHGIGEGSALLIGDSFGDSISKLLGLEHEYVYTKRELHGKWFNEGANLQAYIDEYTPDVVYFVANTANHLSLLEHTPDFFSSRQ